MKLSNEEKELLSETMSVALSFEKILLIAMIVEDIIQEFLGRITPKSRTLIAVKRARAIAEILIGLYATWHIMKAIWILLSNDPENEESDSKEEAFNKLLLVIELMIFLCLAISVTGTALYNLKILKQIIKKDRENYMMYLAFKWLFGEEGEEEKKEEKTWIEKVGYIIRFLGDIATIAGAGALWVSEIKVVPREYALIAISVGAMVGLAGDIVHDKKISIYDVATAIYAGIFLASAIFKIR